MVSQLRILIIEDSEDDALLLLRTLRRHGYDIQFERVETADAMKLALDRQPWDIVLSDYSMPRFDAPTALNILKESGLDIPFIIVSGTIGEDTAVASLKAGAHDFLAKGKLARLIPAIERELREAENRRKRRKADAELIRKTLFVELLQEIAVAANQASNISEVLQFALDRICAYLDLAVGHVYVPNRDIQDALVPAHLWYLNDPKKFESFQKISETTHTQLVGRILNKHQHVWLKDLREYQNSFARYHLARECGLLSGAAFPILIGNQIAAILEFFSTEIIEPDEPLVNVMSLIGTQLERVIERQQNEMALRIYNQRLKALHSVDQAILRKESSEHIARLILDFIQQQIGAFCAGVILFNFENHKARVIASYNMQENEGSSDLYFSTTDLSGDIIAQLHRKDTLEFKNPNLLQKVKLIVSNLDDKEVRSAILISLKMNEDLLGTLYLGANSSDGFSSRQIEIAKELADQLSIAIRQDRYLQKIEQQTAELEQRVQERTAELQRTKNYIETILNSSSDAIITTTFDGVIQQVNPAFGNLFGYLPDEVFGQSIFTFIDSDSVGALLQAMIVVVNARLPVTIEVLASRKEGSTFDGDLALSPVIEDSTIKGIVGSLRDISERKRMEATLKASEEKYRILVEGAEAAISVFDYDGTLTFINQFAARLLGGKPEDFLTKSIYDLISTENAEQQQAHNRRVIESREGEIIETQFPTNGETRWFRTNIQPLKDDLKEASSVLVIAVDITLQKQLEESLRTALVREKELSELRTRFISMVSHEFRTPLSGIQSSTEILQHYSDRLDEERKASHFNKIMVQINRMVSLLDDVLTVSRADVGATPFNPILLDLNQFCRDLVAEFQSVLDSKHELIYSFAGEPTPVPVDEKLLHQAVSNLLTNAFKYSPEGGIVSLELSFDKNHVIICVKDSGIGIPESDQPHLFDTFHRAGNVGTIEGTGLGLAIVKRSIEAHGGTITFKSSVGMGTTFIISIPFTQTDNLIN